jgi:hypothetical protein
VPTLPSAMKSASPLPPHLVNLRVHQVNFSDRTIRLDPGTTKNDDGRLVEMTTMIYQLLQGLVAGEKTG